MFSTAPCSCPWHARLLTHLNHRLIGILCGMKRKEGTDIQTIQKLWQTSVHTLCFQLNVENGHVWGRKAHVIGQRYSPAQSVCTEDKLKARWADIQLFPRTRGTSLFHENFWIYRINYYLIIPKYEVNSPFSFVVLTASLTIQFWKIKWSNNIIFKFKVNISSLKTTSWNLLPN